MCVVVSVSVRWSQSARDEKPMPLGSSILTSTVCQGCHHKLRFAYWEYMLYSQHQTNRPWPQDVNKLLLFCTQNFIHELCIIVSLHRGAKTRNSSTCDLNTTDFDISDLNNNSSELNISNINTSNWSYKFPNILYSVVALVQRQSKTCMEWRCLKGILPCWHCSFFILFCNCSVSLTQGVVSVVLGAVRGSNHGPSALLDKLCFKCPGCTYMYITT